MIGPELSGQKVNLRPIQDGDLLRRAEWLNDAETVELFVGSPPVRIYECEDAERWRHSLEIDSRAILWAIDSKQGRHIGDVDLHNIDHQERLAKLTILLGDKAFWNNGYGTDAIRTMLRYAFMEFKLERVHLRVYDFNKRGIRCYQKCGFVEVRHTVGTAWSAEPGEVYMSISRERFLANDPYTSL
jgi:RimJ/RimL family protein N-acetyltransferase